MTESHCNKGKDIYEIPQYGVLSNQGDALFDRGFVSAEEFSRPRVKYFLHYPLAIAIAAILLWIFPTDQMTAVSSAIGTVVGAMMMWEFLFTSRVVRFSTLAAIGLMIGYAAGTLNSWLTIQRGDFPLAATIGQTVPELADGVAAALMGCAVLLLVGELIEKPAWSLAQELRVTPGMKWLALVNALIIVAAYAAGRFHQGGMKTTSAHHAGVVAEFLEFLLTPTVVVAGVICLSSPNRKDKFFFSLITLLFLLLLTTQGRRELVYPVLIIIPAARYFGYKWSRLTPIRMLFLGLGFAFLFAGVLTYQLLRVAGYSVRNQSISGETAKVEQWSKEGRAWKIATTSSIQNVKRRTLLVVFLSDLLNQSKTQRTALGQDALLQFEGAIPSAIFHGKPTITEENLASLTYHRFYPDEPNSVFTAGALDFGLWGVIIYPILTTMFCSLFYRLFLRYFGYEVQVFGLFMFLIFIIAPEGQMGGYFISIRNMLAFSMAIYAFARVPRFKLSTSGSMTEIR